MVRIFHIVMIQGESNAEDVLVTVADLEVGGAHEKDLLGQRCGEFVDIRGEGQAGIVNQVDCFGCIEAILL